MPRSAPAEPFSSLLESYAKHPLGDSNVATAATHAKTPSFPIHTVDAISCGNCGLAIVDGGDCELLRVGPASHVAIRAARRLERLPALVAAPRGAAAGGRALRCAECGTELGAVVRLGADAARGPRLLLGAARVRCAPDAVASWSRLPESLAARGDARAAAAVARAAAVAARRRAKGAPAPDPRRYPEDAHGMAELAAALPRGAPAAPDPARGL